MAQLPKVRRACRELIKIGRIWDAVIEDCPWLVAQRGPQGAQSTYHLWLATFEGEKRRISRRRFQEALRRHGARFSLGYTRRAAYQHPVFAKVFPKGYYPKGLCPNADYMVPRVLLGHPMVALEAAKRNADALAKVIRELS